MRPNLGDTKKQDFVKCLKINNLQSLVVPRTGFENYPKILNLTAVYQVSQI